MEKLYYLTGVDKKTKTRQKLSSLLSKPEIEKYLKTEKKLHKQYPKIKIGLYAEYSKFKIEEHNPKS